jgi:hypothetical protein
VSIWRYDAVLHTGDVDPPRVDVSLRKHHANLRRVCVNPPTGNGVNLAA